MIIYKITNQVNGKIYIGCTVAKLQRRWRQHVNANRGYSLNLAIKKYGADSFTQEIIETVGSMEEMFSKEIYWIAFYKSNVSGVGYNMTKGGEVPEPLKGEHHPNFGKPSTNPRWAEFGQSNKGKKLPEWHRQIIIKANTGIKRSDEYKKNLSEIKKAEFALKPNTWGDKISASKKGKPSGKRTLIICLNNNKVYDNYQDAANKLGVSAGNIPQVVNGKYSHTKGYIFQKLTDEHLIF